MKILNGDMIRHCINQKTDEISEEKFTGSSNRQAFNLSKFPTRINRYFIFWQTHGIQFSNEFYCQT